MVLAWGSSFEGLDSGLDLGLKVWGLGSGVIWDSALVCCGFSEKGCRALCPKTVSITRGWRV